MQPRSTLEPRERKLFELLHGVVVTNPFEPEREAIDRALLGDAWSPDFLARMRAIHALSSRHVRRLEEEGRADLRSYGADDRAILRYALLFDLYCDLVDELDALIVRQEAAGAEPCPVPFARATLERLTARGYTAGEARKNLALFFQIRRAFMFLERALVGQSPCMGALRQALWDNVFTRDVRWFDAYLRERMEDFSTLLLGETGTGKGAAASAIGRSGFIPYDAKKQRFATSFAGAFISVNLSQFPEALIASELFGHKKGAFTGAIEDFPGVLASCSPHGSIFLDEIGEIDQPLQIKLLKVLQERSFTPVGSRDQKRFRGRVIAATNKPLDELRSKGGFRDDFFYRLCSDVIEMPSLRRRLAEAPGELEELIALALRRILGTEDDDLLDRVYGTVVEQLGLQYEWPGNVRELEQCVRRVLLKGECGPVMPGLASAASGAEPGAFVRELEDGTLDAQQLLAGYCARLYSQTRSYQEVARRMRIDRRTVKKYVEQSRAEQGRTFAADPPPR